jgi:peptidoglycan/LPS O-acetylase OafA/YrhL
MGRFRAHPIALVTVACLAWVLATALQPTGSDRLVSVAATTLLVSPFGALLWAHASRAKTWRDDAWLAFSSFLLAVASLFAVVVLGWFKPGWLGVLVLSALLWGLPWLGLLMTRREADDAA